MKRESPSRKTPDGEAPPNEGANWGAWNETLRAVGPYLGFGFEVAATLIFFVGGGFLLDRWLATTPWLAVAGGVLGLASSVVLIRRVNDTLRRDAEQSAERDASQRRQ